MEPIDATVLTPESPPVPERFPRKETLRTAFLAVAAGLVASWTFASTFLEPTKNSGSAGASMLGVVFYVSMALVLIPRLERLAGRSLHELAFPRFEMKDWLWLGVGIVGDVLIVAAYGIVLAGLHQQHHVQTGFQAFHLNTNADFVAALVTVAMIGPICEELFFRGFLFNALDSRLPTIWAALISAAIFAAAHGDIVFFPILAAQGVLFAYLYRESGSLMVPMIVHGLHNALFLTAMGNR